MNDASGYPATIHTDYQPDKRPGCYRTLGTLGDTSGALTCSMDVAQRWKGADEIRGFRSFEDAATAVKEGRISAMLMPAAYPLGFNLIQDPRLVCDFVFKERIPPLVLAGKDPKCPAATETIFHHPATELLLNDTALTYDRAVPVGSNPEAACRAANTSAESAVAITNALCADFYGLYIYRTLRPGTMMPWIVLISGENSASRQELPQ
jgi:hypothetical protein